VDISKAWGNVRENLIPLVKETLDHYELKQQKAWFEEEFSKLSGERKQKKLQWLQNPSKMNGYNLKNIRRKASRHFRIKRSGGT
jgi:hypothetical protein